MKRQVVLCSLVLLSACGSGSNSSDLNTEVKPEVTEAQVFDIEIKVLAPKDARVFPRHNNENLSITLPYNSISLDEGVIVVGAERTFKFKVPAQSDVTLNHRYCDEILFRNVNENKSVTIQLERLDLHPLTVKRPDGTTYPVHGTWKVTRDIDGELCSVVPFVSDGSGMDVFPGKYYLEFESRSDNEGRVYKKMLTVDLPASK